MGFMYSKGFKVHHKKIIEIFEIWKMNKHTENEIQGTF